MVIAYPVFELRDRFWPDIWNMFYFVLFFYF